MAGAGASAEVEVGAGDAEDLRPLATGATVGSEAGTATGLLLRTGSTAETETGTRAETRAAAARPRHPTL